VSRPAVSVVVPFASDAVAAQRLREALARLVLRADDELVVADNTPRGIVSAVLDGAVTVARATRQRSSYHARNAGARLATRDWLLFMDSDCIPRPDLLDAYFAQRIHNGCGALAGSILPAPNQTSLAARYARARNFVAIPEAPGAVPTAPSGNLLVRREAYELVGGFEEGIRSGGDVDFCRRIQEAGFTLELRPRAAVLHPHSESLRGYLRIVRRYAAGARWLDQRYPGIAPRWPLWPELWRAWRDAAGLWLRGDLDEASFRLLDGFSLAAHNAGYRMTNRAWGGEARRARAASRA
jgi:glycosyltransferase involved in cell wall biosynthesis